MGLTMNTSEKVGKLLTTLIRETTEGNVIWSVTDVPEALSYATEASVPLYLQTKYNSKIIGIYDIRIRNYTDIDDFHWVEEIGFCIVDEKGRVIWELNQSSPALRDLFNTARLQAAGIDDLLGEMVDD